MNILTFDDFIFEAAKALTREELVAELNKKYPKLNLRDSEDFESGYKNCIWVAGTEDGITAKDEFPLFDYYAEDPQEKRYVFGVHKELGDILDKAGWYAEWHDAGTCFLGPI